MNSSLANEFVPSDDHAAIREGVRSVRGVWNEALAKVGVPSSPINTLSQLLDHPHTRASGMIVDYDHQVSGPLRGIGHPVLINGATREAGLPPPMLGQHTDEILGELGLSSDEIRELRHAQTIG